MVTQAILGKTNNPVCVDVRKRTIRHSRGLVALSQMTLLNEIINNKRYYDYFSETWVNSIGNQSGIGIKSSDLGQIASRSLLYAQICLPIGRI